MFGRLLRRRPVILEFDNHLDARCGQAVLIGVSERWFLLLATRFYLVPLLAGLAGAAFGHYLSVMLQTATTGRDFLTLMGGAAAGAVALWRNRARPVDGPDVFTVHLLRVIEDTECE